MLRYIQFHIFNEITEILKINTQITEFLKTQYFESQYLERSKQNLMKIIQEKKLLPSKLENLRELLGLKQTEARIYYQSLASRKLKFYKCVSIRVFQEFILLSELISKYQ